MDVKRIGYLGPEGTFSHQVAARFGGDAELVPLPSVLDVCAFAAESDDRRGVVPVENSSGGPIAETIDLLINNKFALSIERSFWVGIRLALLGRRDNPIAAVYSHATPLAHCDGWLRRELPNVRKEALASTAQAAKRALSEPGAAAIGSLGAAALYGLDVLTFPIDQDVPNITQFYVLGKQPDAVKTGDVKTSLSVLLLDTPGSLYDFLEPFKRDRANLTRIISRPVYGKPGEYAFYVDVQGDAEKDPLRKTIADCRKACECLRVIGAYSEEEINDL